MAVIEMSLTEALRRKKLLNKRIEKIDKAGYEESISGEVLDIIVGESTTTLYSKVDKDKFKKDVKAKYQKYCAILSNYENICKAISKANNVTEVVIGGKTMTISEAIALKSSGVISAKKRFLAKLCNDTRQVETAYDNIFAKANNPNDISTYLAAVLSDEDKKDVDKVSEAENLYHKKRDPVIVDPLQIDKLIESISTEIEKFESEVDYKLSEINSITKIEVELED